MNRFFAIMVSLFFSVALMHAQEIENEQQIRTIFSGSEVKSLRGYGALSIEYTTIDNLDAICIGGRGAVIVNHNLAFGIGGKGFISNTVYDNYLLDDYEFSGGYGGFYIEPIIMGNNPVHLSFPVLIGAGGIGYLKHWGEDDGDDNYVDEDSNAFFVLEPGVEIEFNMIKWMRMAIVGSYRFTSDINLKYKKGGIAGGIAIAPSDMLRSFNVGLVFKFGKF